MEFYSQIIDMVVVGSVLVSAKRLERITRLQGDWRYFQCKECCHDAIYYNKDMVMELNDKIVNDCLPEAYIPRCPVCVILV